MCVYMPLKQQLEECHVAGNSTAGKGRSSTSRRNGGGSNVSRASKVPLNEETFKTAEEKHQKWRFLIATLVALLRTSGGFDSMFGAAI